MEAAVYLHALLLRALMFMILLLLKIAPKIYQWNRVGGWVYLPWYKPPEPGSFREWAEGPRVSRFLADASTTFLLFAVCMFIVALTLVVLHGLPIS